MPKTRNRTFLRGLEGFRDKQKHDVGVILEEGHLILVGRDLWSTTSEMEGRARYRRTKIALHG